MRLREVQIVEAREPITLVRVFAIERVYDGRKLFVRRQHKPWQLCVFPSKRRVRMFLRRFKDSRHFKEGYSSLDPDSWSSYLWAMDLDEVQTLERAWQVHDALQRS